MSGLRKQMFANGLVVGLSLLSCTTVTSGAPAADAEKPELAIWLDQKIASVRQSEDVATPPIVDDGTFLRRVYLDLAGRIPSIAEVRDFTENDSPGKRLAVIDQLLADPRFGEHTAHVWRRVLIPPSVSTLPRGSVNPIHTWLVEAFNENVPYNEIARRLVIAGGAEDQDEVEQPEPENPDPRMAMAASGPAAYLLSTGGNPASMASSVSRVFLGVRLECAQCHDHPFTDWTQKDFWGVAAFFAGARVANRQVPRPDGEAEPQPPVDTRTTSISDEAGNSYTVSLPWDNADDKIEIPEAELPRRYFATWLTAPENPHFAATAVNRLWEHLCGRGLTESVDDLDQATEEEREAVLDDLAEKFAENQFDVKKLVRGICASDFYQSASTKAVAESNAESRPLKVLTPEQLFDSLEVALALPISSIDRGPRFNGQRTALLSRMEEALGASPREFRSGIPQALTLMNGQLTADATDLEKSRTLRAVIDAPFLNVKEKVEALFLATLSRAPHDNELTKVMDLIDNKPSEQEKAEAFSEIMWGLINSPEFVLVR